MKQRDLIVFGEDWGGLPSSTQHLIKHLSKNRKVLWVNSIGLRGPRLNIRDLKRIGQKVQSFLLNRRFQTKGHRDSFSVINPIAIPAPKNIITRTLSALLLQKQINPASKKMGLYRPILWTSLPTAVDLIGKLNESNTVYYCCDDFSGLEGVDHKTIVRHEEKLLSQCDLLITSSVNLTKKFVNYGPKELRHGVDFDLFDSPTEKATDLPNDKRPCAGFYGSLSSWLDIDLLENVILAMPHWNFIFIGEEAIDVSVLKRLDNTFFLGQKSHNMLPSYSQHWDAALLPFKNNKQIQACNPLKLSEYLAAGKPIISTNFPAIAKYKEYVQRANDSESFINALELSQQLSFLTEHKNTLKKQVIHSSWKNKSRQLDRWLEAL